MSQSNEDLAREVNQLREEVQQMKELVNLLLNLIIEQEDEGGEDAFTSMAGMSSPSDFKLNN